MGRWVRLCDPDQGIGPGKPQLSESIPTVSPLTLKCFQRIGYVTTSATPMTDSAMAKSMSLEV